RPESEAAGPRRSLPAGYLSSWWTQNRKGSAVCHGKVSGSTERTGGFMTSGRLSDTRSLERQALCSAKRLSRQIRPSSAPSREQSRAFPDESGPSPSGGLDSSGSHSGNLIGALERQALCSAKRLSP